VDKNDCPSVTFVITACKRLELFRRTIETFKACCEDADLIKVSLCGDDGSSPADIREMEAMGFKVIENARRGHGNNLNNLYSRVETRYIFQCEDDWEFIHPGHFIREAFDIMCCPVRPQECPPCDIRQVVLTTQKDRHEGIIPATTPGGVPYLIQKYAVYGKSCNPPFSLNPGLNDLTAIMDTGFFENEGWFEQKFGEKFWKKYDKACFAEPYVRHLGEGKSAYDLNGTRK
jgi:hypothetical protein